MYVSLYEHDVGIRRHDDPDKIKIKKGSMMFVESGEEQSNNANKNAQCKKISVTKCIYVLYQC
jgi:hypothetical protein